MVHKRRRGGAYPRNNPEATDAVRRALRFCGLNEDQVTEMLDFCRERNWLTTSKIIVDDGVYFTYRDSAEWVNATVSFKTEVPPEFPQYWPVQLGEVCRMANILEKLRCLPPSDSKTVTDFLFHARESRPKAFHDVNTEKVTDDVVERVINKIITHLGDHSGEASVTTIVVGMRNELYNDPLINEYRVLNKPRSAMDYFATASQGIVECKEGTSAKWHVNAGLFPLGQAGLYAMSQTSQDEAPADSPLLAIWGEKDRPTNHFFGGARRGIFTRHRQLIIDEEVVGFVLDLETKQHKKFGRLLHHLLWVGEKIQLLETPVDFSKPPEYAEEFEGRR